MDHQEATDTLAAERYLLGEMEGAERDAFEAHFFDCAYCADDVRDAALMKDGVRTGLMNGKRRTSVRQMGWRPAIAIPWAAAATLAIIAGYESVHTRGTADGNAPIALTPVTLRPETRGQDPVVSPNQGGAVTLAVALQSTYSGSIQYELRRGDRTIAAAEVAAPAAGAPLLLLIPSSLLNSAGQYEVVVKDPRSTALTSEEYRFRVESR
jgi:hypothetical protein